MIFTILFLAKNTLWWLKTAQLLLLSTGCGGWVGGVINGESVLPGFGTRVTPGDGETGGWGVGATMVHCGTLQQLSVGSCTNTQYDGTWGYRGHLPKKKEVK